jgi:PPOX class probable F420-dependent enzyme
MDDAIATLVKGPNFAALTTLTPSGAPSTHVMWVDADDDHVLINTEVHRVKYRNMQRDPRVAITIWDSQDPYRYVEVRGRVVDEIRGPDARAHIDACAQRYTGTDFTHEVVSERAILRIAPDRVVRKNM